MFVGGQGLTLFRAGSERLDNRAVGLFGPPSNLKKTNCSDKRQMALDNSLEDLQFFWVRSILMSPEVIANNMLHDLDR